MENSKKEGSLDALLSEKNAEIEALKEEKKRMESELNLAKDLQLKMIPRVFPEHRNYSLYAKLIPAREVGGDFYDFYPFGNDYLGIVMGDVSGKGVAAGFIMSICKALLKSKGIEDKSTASIVTHVNEQMATNNPNYMFTTVFIAMLNLKTGELTYTNAGHNPTYIIKKKGGLEKLSTLHGPVVGAMEGIKYKESKVQIEAGDTIFAYTDGITEAHNLNQELFSDQRLFEALNKPFISVKKTVEQIFLDILLFERGAEQFDDITALCIQYKR